MRFKRQNVSFLSSLSRTVRAFTSITGVYYSAVNNLPTQSPYTYVYRTSVFWGPCTIPQLHFTWRKFNRIKEKRFVFSFSFFKLKKRKMKNESFFHFRFFISKTKMEKRIVFCSLFNILLLSNSLNRQDPLYLYVSTIQFSVGEKTIEESKNESFFL